MTRKTAERKMVNKVKELIDIYKKYNPNGDYLAVGIFIKQGSVHINNSHWDEDIDAPIDINVQMSQNDEGLFEID